MWDQPRRATVSACASGTISFVLLDIVAHERRADVEFHIALINTKLPIVIIFNRLHPGFLV